MIQAVSELTNLSAPAWVAATSIGVVAFARTVLWVKDIIKPVHFPMQSGNNHGEWRGRMQAVTEQNSEVLKALSDGMIEFRQTQASLLTGMGTNTEEHTAITELLERQTTMLERQTTILESLQPNS